MGADQSDIKAARVPDVGGCRAGTVTDVLLLKLYTDSLMRQKSANGDAVARAYHIKLCECAVCRSKRRWMITATVAVVGTAMLFALPSADWVGHAQIPLEFVILDGSTGSPIEGATVRLLLDDDPQHAATTGPAGRLRVVLQFTTGGRSSVLRRTRVVNYNLMVTITAVGHQPLSVALAEPTREPRYHSDPNPPPIVIRLAPSPTRF
jgi:hypothetical protein